MSDVFNLEIDIDLKEKFYFPVSCKQNDDINLIFNVYNNSVAVDLSNFNCRLRALKSDLKPLIQSNNIDISGNVITIGVDKQLTTTSGLVQSELQLIDKTTNLKKHSFNINILVIKSVLQVDRTISKATYDLLNELEYNLDKVDGIEINWDRAQELNNSLLVQNPLAATNIESLKTENDKAPGLTNNLKIENDRADNNIPDLNNLNDTAEEKLEEFRLYDTTELNKRVQQNTAQLSDRTTYDDANVQFLFNKQNDLSVGTGECLIIKAYGKTIMIDTGSKERKDTIKAYLERNGITKIDYLIISHYDEDHCENFYDNMTTYLDFSTCVCYLPLVSPSTIYPQFNSGVEEKISELGLTAIYPNEGDNLTINDKFNITFYNCGQVAFNELKSSFDSQNLVYTNNDFSMLAYIKHINTTVLYSGDIEKIAQTRLYNKSLFKSVGLYKHHHHGVNNYGSNVNLDYFKMISPKYAVVLTDVPNYTLSDCIHHVCPVYNANYMDTIFTSDGASITLLAGELDHRYQKDKYNENYQITRIENDTNSDINNYYGILQGEFLSDSKAISILFHISDVQGGAFDGVYHVYCKVSTKTTVQKMYIKKISGEGLNVTENFYMTFGNGIFDLYLKRLGINCSSRVRILSMNRLECNITLFDKKLTESEFTTKYASAIIQQGSTVDTGWINLPLSNGGTYNSFIPQYRRVGNIIYLRGAITGISALGTTFSILPLGFRTSMELSFVCASLEISIGKVSIYTNGSIAITGFTGNTISTTNYISLSNISFLVA